MRNNEGPVSESHVLEEGVQMDVGLRRGHGFGPSEFLVPVQEEKLISI